MGMIIFGRIVFYICVLRPFFFLDEMYGSMQQNLTKMFGRKTFSKSKRFLYVKKKRLILMKVYVKILMEG
jgi:hypothetical protein